MTQGSEDGNYRRMNSDDQHNDSGTASPVSATYNLFDSGKRLETCDTNSSPNFRTQISEAARTPQLH